MDSPERWLPLQGFTNYQISSLGRVKGPRGIRAERTDPSNGYKYIILWKARKRVNLKIHRLVCEAFHGSPPFQGAQALHKDGAKDNCAEDNLYWGTAQENSQDTIRVGNFQRGEKHYRTSLTWDEVNEIRRRYLAGEKQAVLAREFGIRSPNCSEIVRNKVWKDHNYAVR